MHVDCPQALCDGPAWKFNLFASTLLSEISSKRFAWLLRFAKATEAGQALVAILQVNGEVGSVLVERVPLLRFSTANWYTKKRRPAARRTRRHRILQIPPMITG